ncbi:MAG: SCO family protein [Flavisolibacter sp.]
MNYHRKTVWLFVLIVILVPVIAFGLVSWYETKYQKLKVYGKDNHTIDDFNLTNQFGKTASTKNWENKIVVVDFFFTHCPTICPKMTKNLNQVQQSFANDDQVLINSFTVDPDRDSAGRLLNYASQFNIRGNWDLLTGNKKEIYRLARNSFLIVATDGDGGPNDFIHSEKLVLIDKMKRIRGYYDGTNKQEVNQLIRDINKLKSEN